MSVATTIGRDVSQFGRQDDPVSIEASFEELYSAHHGRIFGLALRMMGNVDDASDATQETFISAYRNIDKFQPQSRSGAQEGAHLSAWLYRIARNKCIDALRKRKRSTGEDWDTFVATTPAQVSAESQPEIVALHNDRSERIHKTLNQMSRRYRTALIMHEYQGLSVREVASAMGRSESAVKSLLFRARGQFRSLYGPELTVEQAA